MFPGPCQNAYTLNSEAVHLWDVWKTYDPTIVEGLHQSMTNSWQLTKDFTTILPHFLHKALLSRREMSEFYWFKLNLRIVQLNRGDKWAVKLLWAEVLYETHYDPVRVSADSLKLWIQWIVLDLTSNSCLWEPMNEKRSLHRSGHTWIKQTLFWVLSLIRPFKGKRFFLFNSLRVPLSDLL